MTTTTNKKDNNKKNLKQTSTFDLNLHVHRLLLREPFFAGVSRCITKIPTADIPTAGVAINPHTIQFELYYNPEYFEKLSDKERLGVLKHELYHLVLGHITDRKPINPANPRQLRPEEIQQLKIWNYAADCAINSYISDEIPENCLLPGKAGTEFADLKPHQAAEYYYEILKKKVQDYQDQLKNGGGGNGEGNSSVKDALGSGQFDSHDKWNKEGGAGHDDDTINEIAKERTKEILRKAVQEAGEAGSWGTISNETRQDILDRISSKLDWRKVLRYFIKTSKRAHKSSTIKRINKRYQYIHPGKRVNRTANILVCIDQSGSVSDVLLTLFFGELAGLSKIAEFTVLFFDSEIDEKNIFVWKKGQHVKPHRTRCGGTNFDAPTAYVNDNPKFDGCIILTDLEAPKPKSCKAPRLWISDESHAARPYFQTNERVISIPDSDIRKASGQ